MLSSFIGLLVIAFGSVAIAQTAPQLSLGTSTRNSRANSSVELNLRYTSRISPSYDYRFGRQAPFLPSNARTADGLFIPPGSFPTAAYCGHCHQAAYRQWSESAHRYSFQEPFYKKNVDLLIQGKGIAFSRHCEGCHNPIALFSGALSPGSHINRSFDADGITCSVCHSISKLQPPYGVGSYVMGTPSVIVDAKGHPIPGTVPYREILEYPDRHKRAVMRDFYKSPEFCGACHEANLPQTLNGYRWFRAISTYDEWQRSPFSQRSPLQFYKSNYASCQNCHMPKEPIRYADPGAKDGLLASHRWLGGNTAIPFYYHLPDRLRAIRKFLAKRRVDIDIFALKQSPSAALLAPLGSTHFTVVPGRSLQAIIVIHNGGLGHSLIPEQRDIFEAWVEFVVKDQTGHEIFHSGYVEPNGTLDSHAYSFTNRLIGKDGQLLSRHEVWERRAVAWDKTIQPGHSVIVRYEFAIPAKLHGKLTLTARVNYRHLNQKFLNFVLGSNHPVYPIVKMAEASQTINIGQNDINAHQDAHTPDWMRWNNYGTALLDEGLNGQAAEAFGHVEAIMPHYADGFVNEGLADLQWENIDAASLQFKHALSLNPDDARARYYLGLAEMNSGQLRLAAKTLRTIAGQFPDSIALHQELGICYYLSNRNRLASDEFKSVQAVQPDNLTAHFYLALLYRRLGKPSLAQSEAKLYANEKSDPAAPTIALKFFETNEDLYAESLSTHVYTDSSPSYAPSASTAMQNRSRPAPAPSTTRLPMQRGNTTQSLTNFHSASGTGGNDQ